MSTSGLGAGSSSARFARLTLRLVVSLLALIGVAGTAAGLTRLGAAVSVTEAGLVRDAREMGLPTERPPRAVVVTAVLAEEATDLVAPVLALLLVWMGRGGVAALWMGLFLAIWPVGSDELRLVGLPAGLQDLLVPLAFVALLRFVVLFPRPLTPDDLERATRGPGVTRLLVGPGFGRVSRWLLDLRTFLALVAGCAAAFYLVREVAPRGALFLGTGLLLGLLVQTARLLAAQWRVRRGRERERLQWIGVAVALVLWTFLGLSLVYGLAYFEVLAVAGRYTPLVSQAASVTGAAVIALLAVAVLYQGAIDPALILYRTILYGALGLGAVVGFAALESVLSELLEARLGLPGLIGPTVAGVVTALVLFPVHEALRRVAGQVAPVTGAPSAPSTEPREEPPRPHDPGEAEDPPPSSASD